MPPLPVRSLTRNLPITAAARRGAPPPSRPALPCPRALAIVLAYLSEPLEIALREASLPPPSPPALLKDLPAAYDALAQARAAEKRAKDLVDTLLMLMRASRRRLRALQDGGSLALTSVRRANAWVAEQRRPHLPASAVAA